MKEKPNHIVIHVGTNDLSTHATPYTIAKSILDLGVAVSSETTVVSISGLVPRKDKHEKKRREVNILIQKFCSERNIAFISHDKINPPKHLNQSKLHLNKSGNKLFTKSFKYFLTKY